MKTRQIRILAALAVGGFMACSLIARADGTNTPAQPPGDHQGRGDMRAKMAEELGLSDDQKAKMADVMKEQGPKRKAIQEDTTLSQEDKRAKGKALREETQTKIKAILTADQYEKWLKMQQGRRGGPGGKPPGDGNSPATPPATPPADKS